MRKLLVSDSGQNRFCLATYAYFHGRKEGMWAVDGGGF